MERARSVRYVLLPCACGCNQLTRHYDETGVALALDAARLDGLAERDARQLHPLATAVLDAVEARERTARHTMASWPATIAVANAAHAWRDAGFQREVDRG